MLKNVMSVYTVSLVCRKHKSVTDRGRMEGTKRAGEKGREKIGKTQRGREGSE